MKTVARITLRILILLAAAMLVVGALLLIDRAAPVGSLDRGEGGRFEKGSGFGQGQLGANTQGGAITGQGRGDHHEFGENGSGLSVFTIATLFKNLLLIVLSGLLVWVITLMTSKKTRRARA